MWIKTIPIPVIACLIEELVDNTTHVNGDCPQITVMYVFIGLTVAISVALQEAHDVHSGSGTIQRSILKRD